MLEQSERVERFLLELRHVAHKNLTPDRAESLVNEVRSHLRETIDAHVAEGRLRYYAEFLAIEGFGKPQRFVQTIAEQQYNSAFAMYVRTATVLFTYVGLVTLAMGRGSEDAQALATLILMLGSLAGRRVEFKRLLVGGLGAALTSYLLILRSLCSHEYAVRTAGAVLAVLPFLLVIHFLCAHLGRFLVRSHRYYIWRRWQHTANVEEYYQRVKAGE